MLGRHVSAGCQSSHVRGCLQSGHSSEQSSLQCLGPCVHAGSDLIFCEECVLLCEEAVC